MLKRLIYLALSLTAYFLSGCDSSEDPGAGGGGGSGLTAKVDGTNWEADPTSIVAQTNFGVPGAVMILGTRISGAKTLGITMTLYNVGGPGKYPLGTDMSVYGGIGQLGEGTGSGGDANSWITPSTGAAGMVEITSIGEGRVAGTYSYHVEPGSKNATGANREVTAGVFDLPLKGTFAKLADGAGSMVSATLAGQPYYAATVNGSLTDFMGTAGVRINTATSLHGVNIELVGVTAPGTYTYSNTAPQRLITAGRTGGDAAHCCWGVNASGDVAEIVVTSLTAHRVQGTFTATLKPQPGKAATADLVIQDGKFDIGIR